MTHVTLIRDRSGLVGFEAKGHTGYADEGSDIVCAAVSSTIGLVECAINTVMGLAASVKIDADSASISFHLPGGLSEEIDSTCQTLLVSLMVYLASLQEEYPDNITVLEV